MDELDLSIRNETSSSFVRYGVAPTADGVAAALWWEPGASMAPDWRPRPPDESQAILDRLGSTGPFRLR